MKRKILIVDDEQIIVEVVKIALGGDSSYEVLVATDGQAAVDVARDSQPDLILLDVDMPVMDGIDACKVLKSDASTGAIPVIMLTAMAQQRDIELGMKAGADYYITKPFSPSFLLGKVGEVLRTLYPVGQSVRLKDGRVGTISQRISMDLHDRHGVGYHVALETGTVATVPATDLEALA